MPDDYDTDVRKRGGRLSAGQRQLVAFARASLADPAVLGAGRGHLLARREDELAQRRSVPNVHTAGMGGRSPDSVAKVPSVRSSELLGYAPDARVLIVNGDDLGMYHAINVAIIDSIEHGIASSCSLMVPCPWALHAMQLLRQRPQIPFGIHLTLVRDTALYWWGPLTEREKVPSLLDEAGHCSRPKRLPSSWPELAWRRLNWSSARRSTPWSMPG